MGRTLTQTCRCEQGQYVCGHAVFVPLRTLLSSISVSALVIGIILVIVVGFGEVCSCVPVLAVLLLRGGRSRGSQWFGIDMMLAAEETQQLGHVDALQRLPL
jgi:hypothetical protein